MKDKSFTINILSDEQESIAWQFAGSNQGTLEIDWDNKGISPKINGSVAWMECKPWREHGAGDHVLFIGEIEELHFEVLEALTFYRGKMGSAKQLVKSTAASTNSISFTFEKPLAGLTANSKCS